MTTSGFAVLISVYHAETASNLREALKSITTDQTLRPSQVMLVLDGPVGAALETVVSEYTTAYPEILEVLRLEKNMGLGNALARGLQLCRYELVARMDSDDISHPSRFETQFRFLNAHPEISVVGSNIEEFSFVPGDMKVFKTLPESPEAVRSYSKKRCPVNHPSIMFRKSAILAVGNYNDDYKCFEDYNLFARMMVKGFNFYNIQEALLYFRIGNRLEMIKRRSGWSYMLSEVRFLKFARSIGHFNRIEFLKALCIRVPTRLLPAKIVLKIYSKFLRA
ncbi:MAG TPA: glycosyltransferase [Pedobacter sp.]|nr:glycosyltransferase [Pedobacter sp.]